MLVIRLTRVGKKNSPIYRVVVADKRRAVKRKFIEIMGHYNPTLKPKTVVIDKERALFWMKQGAQPSDTVRNLMVDLGILAKDKKANKVFGKKFSKKAIKEGADKKPEKIEEPVETRAEEVAEEATEKTVESATEEVTPEVENQPESVENIENEAETIGEEK